MNGFEHLQEHLAFEIVVGERVVLVRRQVCVIENQRSVGAIETFDPRQVEVHLIVLGGECFLKVIDDVGCVDSHTRYLVID